MDDTDCSNDTNASVFPSEKQSKNWFLAKVHLIMKEDYVVSFPGMWAFPPAPWNTAEYPSLIVTNTDLGK